MRKNNSIGIIGRIHFDIWIILVSIGVTTAMLLPTARIICSASARRTNLMRSALFSSSSRSGNNNNQKDRMASTPLVVCGPSGVGKGTIIERYMQDTNDSTFNSNNNNGYGKTTSIDPGKNHFGFTVSHTTRLPRPGETDAVHYHFVSTQQEMKTKIENNEFLEYAQVHGNFYGTSWSSIQDVVELYGKRCLLDIDVQGVKHLKQIEEKQKNIRNDDLSNDETNENNNNMPLLQLQPKYIFIAPPSFEVLSKRLADRGTETPESLQRRLQNAQAEMDYGVQDGNFDCIVVNDDLDQACREFRSAVQSMYTL